MSSPPACSRRGPRRVRDGGVVQLADESHRRADPSRTPPPCPCTPRTARGRQWSTPEVRAPDASETPCAFGAFASVYRPPVELGASTAWTARPEEFFSACARASSPRTRRLFVRKDGREPDACRGAIREGARRGAVERVSRVKVRAMLLLGARVLPVHARGHRQERPARAPRRAAEETAHGVVVEQRRARRFLSIRGFRRFFFRVRHRVRALEHLLARQVLAPPGAEHFVLGAHPAAGEDARRAIAALRNDVFAVRIPADALHVVRVPPQSERALGLGHVPRYTRCPRSRDDGALRRPREVLHVAECPRSTAEVRHDVRSPCWLVTCLSEGAGRHTITSPASPPDASASPPGEKRTQFTVLVCAVSVSSCVTSGFPSASSPTRHSLISLSVPHDASKPVAGSKSTLSTGFFSCHSTCNVFTFIARAGCATRARRCGGRRRGAAF